MVSVASKKISMVEDVLGDSMGSEKVTFRKPVDGVDELALPAS